MTDAEFLEMCRLATAADTGGQWTDEKIDAIEQCQADPRGVVTRLYKMLAAMTQRAEAAEAALADTVITWLQCSNNMVRAKEQTLAASRDVLAAEQANTTALQDLSVRLESVLSRVTAGQRFAQPQEVQP